MGSDAMVVRRMARGSSTSAHLRPKVNLHHIVKRQDSLVARIRRPVRSDVVEGASSWKCNAFGLV